LYILSGSKKIPEVAQGTGNRIREFKKALNDVQKDIKNAGKPESTKEKK
jgi:Sec-independent protein translocase protein TatA